MKIDFTHMKTIATSERPCTLLARKWKQRRHTVHTTHTHTHTKPPKRQLTLKRCWFCAYISIQSLLMVAICVEFIPAWFIVWQLFRGQTRAFHSIWHGNTDAGKHVHFIGIMWPTPKHSKPKQKKIYFQPIQNHDKYARSVRKFFESQQTPMRSRYSSISGSAAASNEMIKLTTYGITKDSQATNLTKWKKKKQTDREKIDAGSCKWKLCIDSEQIGFDLISLITCRCTN